ncbi:tRNA preQ1(34) S-adenosylmethionine ribosyltransferase-isomerase QueA [Roseibacillus ishigakijimensis]|uniref:tRNA preQ1(34) S-adenosylmethionine ribosyltransferase-isomerase QueA n=1 Tax=Roseibacillus ishigakijimensis TaxID=454146 RepID=UPI0031F32B3E
MRTADFHYDLPEELIASHPLEDRTASRMMVVDRTRGTIEHRQFADFVSYVTPEDLLVLNDTKVVPARFFSNDGKIELLRVEELSPLRWRSLVRPGKKMKPGRTVEVGAAIGTVEEIDGDGNRLIAWDRPPDPERGALALPHYMERDPEKLDETRYQTTFAKEEGAIAAPTAGLHFTPEILARLPHAFLTLHVGIGTFRPVKSELVSEHHMHSENYHLSPDTARRIREKSGRTIAIGTTVTRVLEHLAEVQADYPAAASGATDIFIHPPRQLKAVDALLTNFHLPESTLLMLVSAMAGRDLILEAYRQAVAERYRFFSYGDCMLIL